MRAALLALLVMTTPALSHEWYTRHKDPVYRWSCCGGTDCAQWTIRPGSITAEESGYHIKLTLDETKKINPQSIFPIDALVVWERVQASEDGNWHLCLMPSNRHSGSGGVYCLFAPPNT